MSATRALRTLLRCYPKAWRQGREEEMLWMLEQERASGRPVSGATLIDVAGHGLEARVDSWLAGIPRTLRSRVGLLATSALAVLSLLFLILVERGGLTLAAPLYSGWLLAFTLTVLRRGGSARLVMALLTTATAVVPVLSAFTDVPRPPLFVLGPLGLLSVAGCLTTPRLRRQGSVRLLGFTALTAAVLALQVVGWSTFAHRGAEIGAYRDSNDLSILAISIQGSLLLGSVWVALRTAYRSWLLPISVTGTLLLLYCDPSEPVLALAVFGLCWAATAIALAHTAGRQHSAKV